MEDTGQGYHYPVENLAVMSTDGSEGPIYISKNGGAWIFDWSPNSQLLAYTDYDENDTLKIYSADYHGNQHVEYQTLPEAGNAPDGILWSPNSKYFVLKYIAFDRSNLWIANSENQNIVPVGEVDEFWWEDDNILGTWDDDVIRWIDPASGKVVRSLENVPAGNGGMKPFGSTSRIACFWCFEDQLEYGLKIFDVNTRELYKMPNVTDILDVAGWEAAPDSFPRQDICNPSSKP